VTASDSSDAVDGTVERPESDDYDLLTFGEVSARLSELLRTERATLERVRGQSAPDQIEVQRLENRIELLSKSARRYEQQQRTNEVFANRFGAARAENTDPSADRD
jgi:hypothetical protein